MPRKKKEPLDLVGQKYGSWTVLRPGKIKKDARGNVRPRWVCVCSKCQKEYDIDQYALTDGRSTQCKPCAMRRSWNGNGW